METTYKTYKITAERKDGSTFSDTVFAPTPSEARKDFSEIYRHGKPYAIIGCEVCEENISVTKELERAALEKIKRIVESLGSDSYIAAAFEGCFEIAEENIENDFGCSMKQRAEKAEKDAKYFQDAANHESEENEKKDKEIAVLREQTEALQQQLLSADDLYDIQQLTSEKVEEKKQTVKDAAERIVAHAEIPSSDEFQQAVKDHRTATSGVVYYTALLERVCKVAAR